MHSEQEAPAGVCIQNGQEAPAMVCIRKEVADSLETLIQRSCHTLHNCSLAE